LQQNYPNPFNGTTSIVYRLPRNADVQLTLFDVQGRKVATLVDGPREAGSHTVRWQPLSLSSGLCFVRLEAGNVSVSRKIAYLK
jgi:hypothetical protein